MIRVTMMVSYPKKETEFEVQAELYCKLKEQGFNVRGEIPEDGSRLDLVVFDKNDSAKCIIEVKNWKNDCDIEKNLMKLSRKAKHERYLKFNLNLLYCVNSGEIDKTIEEIKKILLRK